MLAYCTRAQFASFGLPAKKWEGRETDVDAQILGSSKILDGFLRRARYVLPLASWGEDVAKVVAEHATLGVMITLGMNPGAGSDLLLVQRGQDALALMEKIITRGWEPEVVDSSGRSSARPVPLPVSDPRAGY